MKNKTIVESLNNDREKGQEINFKQALAEVEGSYSDVITYADGTKEEHAEEKNIIIIDFAKLVAVLFNSASGYSGITHLAIGQGSPTWDDMSTSERKTKSTVTLKKLYDEIARTTTVISYLDDDNNEVTLPEFLEADNEGARLKMEAFFGLDVSGYLREFGVFGGNATDTKDSGIMINHKAHGLVSMNTGGVSGMTLSRTYRLRLY